MRNAQEPTKITKNTSRTFNKNHSKKHSTKTHTKRAQTTRKNSTNPANIRSFENTPPRNAFANNKKRNFAAFISVFTPVQMTLFGCLFPELLLQMRAFWENIKIQNRFFMCYRIWISCYFLV